ncbi:unnamed protein product [Mytilus edulis]|uniref:Uncharacterized protein n=1 Tax=Mytilus edulis TaxID=6550 RepID=A0A8S3QK15_MYTED|nr:unnamed protein product [Mytilus edulis]
MNMCNYAKVILARSTKDPDNLKWWNNKQVENSKENSIYTTVPNHSQNINVFQRYNNYHVIMNKYPKMYIPLAEFKSRVPRVQIYLTKTKYWKNCNKSGEKTLFIEKYNLKNWCKLSEIERKGHQQNDCNICKSDAFHTSLHAASAPQTTNDIDQLCTQLTTTVCNTSKTNNDGKMIKVVKTIVPYIEKKTGSNFTDKKFINEIKSLPAKSNINWTELSRKYQVKNSYHKFPLNGGQVLYQFAKSEGVEVNKFNETKRISGRDYFRRVRRAKHILCKRLSTPTPRPAKQLKKEVRELLQTGDLDIGVAVAPKVFKSNNITTTGELVEKIVTVYGRKFPLHQLCQKLTNEQSEMGFFRASANTIHRHLKLWHDHSGILSRPYFLIMVSCLFDENIYLTNEEYTEKYPDQKAIDVQSIVEKPKLYIFGQSKSSDSDQMSYSTTRVEDLKDLSTPSIAPDGLKVYDIVRIFTGDNPARQFECGQQRGGNYRCICGLAAVNHSNFEAAFIQKTQSLQQRLDLFKAGTLWKTFNMQNNINPFVNLTKETLTDELDYRNLDIYNLKKPELKTLLTETLHGIQRPPALFCPNFDNTCTTENLEQYEISNCEPLHDIVNVVQNLITELPYHLDDNIQKEYLRFFEVTVGDKNELKASNARLYAIKLAHFTNMNYENGLVNADILTICNSLVEIITICYSRSNERTQKQVLRLYNQCFLLPF